MPSSSVMDPLLVARTIEPVPVARSESAVVEAVAADPLAATWLTVKAATVLTVTASGLSRLMPPVAVLSVRAATVVASTMSGLAPEPRTPMASAASRRAPLA